ncbi:Fur family transcriptional regulator [Kibdelosporangium persicum]|uniref:Fur family transcriptional regulator n=1 Tax=Kibdelosporangium persicum TaxID=2698649 RepID=UPI0015643BA5|nr:transcriptional repressor [Kibdelosporangium persicum]
MRLTGKTRQVWEAMSGQDRFSSAMEIHSTLGSRGDAVSLTAVYRSLHLLADAGQVDVLLGPDGQHRYRHCSPTVHHHLLCRQCHRAVEVHGSPSGPFSRERLRELGFADDSVQINLVGLCSTCSSPRECLSGF